MLCQYLPGRYIQPIFSIQKTQTDLLFSQAVPQPVDQFSLCGFFSGFLLNPDENNINSRDLRLNIYEPVGDTLSYRPLVIICFGGGFVGGNKNESSIVLLAENLAKRGYVCATIDYRLGMKITDNYLSQRAVYRGIQDGRAAIRFFRADAAGANFYKIDPDRIFIGGHSAGAFIALHNAYLDLPEEIPAAALDNNYPLLGGLDEAGQYRAFSGKANAIFSLAGAIGDTNYLATQNDIPHILFHDKNDETVPYNQGMPFSNYESLCGVSLPDVFGSNIIHRRAKNLGIISEFHSYTSRGHDVHDSTSTALYQDIIPKISHFFNSNLLQPSSGMLISPTVHCDNDLLQTYEVINQNSVYTDWKIEGGTILDIAPSSRIVEIQWSSSAPLRTITLTDYNKNGSASEPLEIEIQFTPGELNEYQFLDSNWLSTSNWSLGRSPLTCDEVNIPSQTSPFPIHLPANQDTQIKSLNLGNNISLVVPSGQQLKVSDP